MFWYEICMAPNRLSQIVDSGICLSGLQGITLPPSLPSPIAPSPPLPSHSRTHLCWGEENTQLPPLASLSGALTPAAVALFLFLHSDLNAMKLDYWPVIDTAFIYRCASPAPSPPRRAVPTVWDCLRPVVICGSGH